MEEKDLDQIVVLEKLHQASPWPWISFVYAIRAGQECVVVERENEIIGYAVWDKGHGRTICAVSAKAALLLYQAWYSFVKNKGILEMNAETPENAIAPIAMLERFGFNRIGTRPSFYGAGINAIVWSRPTGDRLLPDQA
jgi:ribosomal-protein-alanine N-acetyltransferase